MCSTLNFGVMKAEPDGLNWLSIWVLHRPRNHLAVYVKQVVSLRNRGHFAFCFCFEGVLSCSSNEVRCPLPF